MKPLTVQELEKLLARAERDAKVLASLDETVYIRHVGDGVRADVAWALRAAANRIRADRSYGASGQDGEAD
jgi:hypothetical protein